MGENATLSAPSGSSSYATLIVSYNGEASIVETLHHVCEACTDKKMEILIVDNHSTDHTISVIESAIKNLDLPNVSLLKNPENYGLGKAFNIGVEHFYRKGIEWVLILDQDSYIKEDFFSSHEAILESGQGPTDDVVAICSSAESRSDNTLLHKPYLWDGHSFSEVPDDVEEKSRNSPIVVASAISSGTFYRAAQVVSMGGFNEDYFIDFVDHEFHLRVMNSGKKMLWNQNAVLSHSLGEYQHGGETEVWIEHQAFRYYYMARNMAHGLFKYGGIKGLVLFLKSLLQFLKKVHTNSNTPWLITRNIIKGLFHAALGRTGRLN